VPLETLDERAATYRRAARAWAERAREAARLMLGDDSPAFRAIAAEAVAAVLRSTEALPKLELPLLEVSGGAPSEPADFVTGSVGLNRMQRRCPELSMEVQRRLIYGGDMIVP
jgi:hypothetical protein